MTKEKNDLQQVILLFYYITQVSDLAWSFFLTVSLFCAIERRILRNDEFRHLIG